MAWLPPPSIERIDAVAATLRYLAGAMVVDGDDGPLRDRALSEQKWMVEVADQLECDPDAAEWMCCPLCEEVQCDSGCPLGHLRGS